MSSPATSKATSEQAFCAAIRCLAESPPDATTVEGGHKQGLNRGLLLLDPLHALLIEQTGDCLSIDRFANHLVQLTRNQTKVSFERYWEGEGGQSLHEAALVVQHPSKKPMSLAKLLDILRTCGTSIWLALSAGNTPFCKLQRSSGPMQWQMIPPQIVENKHIGLIIALYIQPGSDFVVTQSVYVHYLHTVKWVGRQCGLIVLACKPLMGVCILVIW